MLCPRCHSGEMVFTMNPYRPNKLWKLGCTSGWCNDLVYGEFMMPRDKTLFELLSNSLGKLNVVYFEEIELRSKLSHLESLVVAERKELEIVVAKYIAETSQL